MPSDKLNPRFELLDDSRDPRLLHDAVRVCEAENFSVAGIDELGKSLLFGAHAFGKGIDCQDMQLALVLGFVFGENLGGVVRGAVVGHPDFPFASVILCQN